jgi:CDP-diacylglycerol--serine O-phosphatidyltransferase
MILPNMVTLCGLLCGIFSITLTIMGSYFNAAVAILLAGVFDGLDGKVARLIKGTSDFGVQLDSLVDVVSFGVAPAMLLFHWQFRQFQEVGIMAAFVFVACGALRLARFNVQTKKISNLFFVGLPIPAAAAMISASILFVYQFDLYAFAHLYLFFFIMVFALAILMVSTLPYYSFKNLGFLKMRPFNTVVILVVVLFFIGSKPGIAIFILMSAYIISGFVLLPLRKRLLAKERAKEGANYI